MPSFTLSVDTERMPLPLLITIMSLSSYTSLMRGWENTTNGRVKLTDSVSPAWTGWSNCDVGIELSATWLYFISALMDVRLWSVSFASRHCISVDSSAAVHTRMLSGRQRLRSAPGFPFLVIIIDLYRKITAKRRNYKIKRWLSDKNNVSDA